MSRSLLRGLLSLWQQTLSFAESLLQTGPADALMERKAGEGGIE